MAGPNFWDPPDESPRGPIEPPAEGAKKKRVRPSPLPSPADSADGASVPTLDAAIAGQLAQLLAAGIPPEGAVQYIVPDMRGRPLTRLTHKWMGSRLVREAVSLLNAGEWHTLSDDQRMSIALTKHRAECAYFLVSHSLESAGPAEVAKIEMARGVLEKFTQGAIDPSDPLAAFARAAKDIMAAALGPTPAQLAGSTIDYRDAPTLGRLRSEDEALT